MSAGIVIVGAGQAGYLAAKKARELNGDIPITLIGDESGLPYQRPPLSKKYLSGEMPIERLMFADQDWYDNQNIKPRMGASVARIDRAQSSLKMSDGSNVLYDKLLLTTGSSPRNLPAEVGGDLIGVHTLRSSTHADDMRKYVQAGKHLVVIGGGYIGLEVSAVAVVSGMKVTVVEMTERILQRVASVETSDYFRNLHQSNGVEIRESATLDHIVSKDGAAIAVQFSDGSRVDTNFVLIGIGAVPNDELAKTSGLAVGLGIQVNQYCQTSDTDIYAAGDCSSFDFQGLETRLESVPNAIHQAEVAAENMVKGNTIDYVATPWFWSDQYDVKLQIAGLNRGYDSTVTRAGKREGAQSVWYYQGDQLQAVDAMNDPASCMIARKVLEANKTIPKSATGNPDTNLKEYV